MFAVRTASFLGIIAAQMPCCCASHLVVTHLSFCHGLQAVKRPSPYNTVDTERYSSLVKSVIMSKVSPQTPLTMQEEDDHMYGPVIKTPPPTTDARGERTTDEETEPEGPPIQIPLKRGLGRSDVPSVTRIIQQTLSTEQIFYLERWKRRMIQELGEAGFKEYSQNLFRQGKTFHSVLEKTLTTGVKWTERDPSEMCQYSPEVRGYMESVGVLCVIDWKTSEKPKPFLNNTYDNPIQVAAYAGALNTDSNYKYQVENGLIVVAYKDGSPAHAHQLNSELMLDYWKTWLLRLEDYFAKRYKKCSKNVYKICCLHYI
ncbi:hypothetical protein WMY93_018200 [Mugilogobius chulae]|uniref:Mitochondrial genome maintenance exonuclease 1 n=1 Tax=Mugilogobius chulae TaxID=88201 RepID=A0AAW0NIG5_9GOBI